MTAEDPQVRHDTTGWTAPCWTETLPRVKWIPTFKVECGRLGYVDDLRRQTHRRCYDTRMMIGIYKHSNQKARMWDLSNEFSR